MDNTQVIYHEDGTITVYSPFGTKPESFDATYRVGWITLGIAVLKNRVPFTLRMIARGKMNPLKVHPPCVHGIEGVRTLYRL